MLVIKPDGDDTYTELHLRPVSQAVYGVRVLQRQPQLTDLKSVFTKRLVWCPSVPSLALFGAWLDHPLFPGLLSIGAISSLKLIEESIIRSSGWSRCQGNRGAAESDSMLLPSSGRHVLRFISTLNPIINPANNASNFRVRSFHGSSSLVESHTSSSCPSTAESLFITP